VQGGIARAWFEIPLGVAASVPYISHSRLSHTIGKAHGNEENRKESCKALRTESRQGAPGQVRAGL